MQITMRCRKPTNMDFPVSKEFFLCLNELQSCFFKQGMLFKLSKEVLFLLSPFKQEFYFCIWIKK